MIKYLQSTLDQNKSVTCISNTVTVTASGIASSVNGTLVKNGVVTGLETISIDVGDTLAVKVLSSSVFSDTVHAHLDLGNDIWVYQVTTKDDPTVYSNLNFDDVGKFDNLILVDQAQYPSANQTTVSLIDVTTATKVRQVQLVPPVPPVAISSTYFAVSDYYKDKVFFLDGVTKAVLSCIVLPAGSLPSSCAYTHDDISSKDYTWVTASGINKLFKIDVELLSIAQEVLIPGRPIGITIDHSDNTLWVTCYALDLVTRYSYSGIQTNQYVVGKGPSESTLDGSGNLWVVCAKDNRVYIIDKLTNIISYVTVGENPWDVEIIDGYAYVSNSFDGTISKIDVATKAVVTTTSVCSFPGDLVSDESGNLWVSSTGDHSVLKMSGGVVQGTIPVPDSPLGMALFDQILLTVSEYAGPTRNLVYSYIPNRISFLNLINSPLDHSYNSNYATISGLREGISIPCSVPQLPGFGIIKNGSPVGTSTTVINEDVLQLQQTSDVNDYGATTSIVLAYGKLKTNWTVTTSVVDYEIDQISFASLSNCIPNTNYTSNDVTISGSTLGIEIPITITGGTLFINGVQKPSPALIKSGDVLSLRAKSSVTEEGTKTVRVTVGNIFEEWVLKTSSTLFDYVGIIPVVPDIVDSPLDSLVHTTLVISGIIDPPPDPPIDPLLDPPLPLLPPWVANTAELYIGDHEDNTLSLNGQVAKSLTVKNEDVVIIQVRSGKVYDNKMSRTVYLNQHVLNFFVYTIPDCQPDLVVFQDLMETVPRAPYESNTVTITGMSLLAEANISVPSGYIVVNSIGRGNATTVKLGDQVQWIIDAPGPFGGRSCRYMTLGELQVPWVLYAFNLNGPVKDRYALSGKKVVYRKYQKFTYSGLSINKKGLVKNGISYNKSVMPSAVKQVVVKTKKISTSFKRLSSIARTVFHKQWLRQTKLNITFRKLTCVRQSISGSEALNGCLFEYPRNIIEPRNVITPAAFPKRTFNAIKNNYKVLHLIPKTVRMQYKKYKSPCNTVAAKYKASDSRGLYRSEKMTRVVTHNVHNRIVGTGWVIRENSPRLITTGIVHTNWVVPERQQTKVVSTSWVFPERQTRTISTLPVTYKLKARSIPSGEAIRLANSNHIILARVAKKKALALRTVKQLTWISESKSSLKEIQHRNALKQKVSAKQIPRYEAVRINYTLKHITISYIKQYSVTKGDKGLGVQNVDRTFRFISPAQAGANGQVKWKFTSVQPIAWGDGTYIWIGDCASYKPFKSAGYISGG